MPDLQLPFIKGDRIANSLETDYRDALPVNMYAVPKKMFGADGYMIEAYGITSVGDATTPSRGGFFNDRFNNQFRVHGNDFIEVDENGVVNVLGAVTGYFPQTNTIPPVTMDYSFNTQAVLANNRFYLYDTTNGFVEVLDPELGQPIDFVWVDGFYFFTDGEDLYHTLLSDETAIDPTDFGVAQFMPDGSLGLGKTRDNKVIVFGRYSTEYFYNDGTDDFAFSRIASRAVKKGIVSTHCKAELGGSWYILGGGREEALSVYVLGAGSEQKVSTREIEKILAQYNDEDLVDASMEAYTKDGISFVQFNLPNETLIFNETAAKALSYEDAWSIYKSDTQGDTPYRGIHGTFDTRIGDWVFGDRTEGNIGRLDETVATHYGAIVEWILFSPFTYLETASIDQFEIETVPGHTTTNDATVFLSLSYDGVFTGSEETVEYGMMNEYGKRFIRYRLGYVRDWFTMRLRGTSRSRVAFCRGFIKYG